MSVECLDARKQLAVVPARDEDLRVGADGGLEDAEGSCGELVLLELRDLVLGQVCARFGLELPVKGEG